MNTLMQMTEIDNSKNVTTVRLNTAINSSRVRFPDSLSVKIPTYARQGLEIAAQEQGLTLSELTRDIIEGYLEGSFKTKNR